MKGEAKRRRERILDTVSPDRRDIFDWLLDEMFGRGTVHRTTNGIASAAYVDRYFYGGIPAGDIADRVIAAAVTHIGDGKDSEARRKLEAHLAGGGQPAASALIKVQAQAADERGQRLARILAWVLGPAVPQTSVLTRAWFREAVLDGHLAVDSLPEMLAVVSDDGLMTAAYSFVQLDPFEVAQFPADSAGAAAVAAISDAIETRLDQLFSAPPPAEPSLQPRTALSFLARTKPATFPEWLVTALDNGPWDALDVAARFVQRMSSDGGRTWHAGEFDPSAFESIVPHPVVAEAVGLAASAEPSIPTVSGDHDNLRLVASAALRRGVASDASEV